MSNIIDTLIFDRTLDDVLRIKALGELALTRELTADELAEWNAAVVKGAYNAEDINRVGEAIVYADAYLSGVQASIDAQRDAFGVADDAYFDAMIQPVGETVPVITDYTASEPPIMETELMLTFRAAEVLARRVRLDYAVPDLSRFGYAAANAVERMIYDAYHDASETESTRKEAAEKMAGAWYFADDLFCGETE